MRNSLLLICFLFSILNSVVSQNKNEELYLEIIENVLSDKIIDLCKIDTVYGGDSCVFISRSDNFVDNTEKRFEFSYGKYLIKVWPGDHVFFFDIKNYVQINTFQISMDRAILNIELYIDKKPIQKINVFLLKKRETWKIKKKDVIQE